LKDDVFDRVLLIEDLQGNFIGNCKLGTPDNDQKAETDVKINPKFWGNKFGQEIKHGLVDYFFTKTVVQIVEASPNLKNNASILMQESVGAVKIKEFTYEFPEAMKSYTETVNGAIYHLYKDEWLKKSCNVASQTNAEIEKNFYAQLPTKRVGAGALFFLDDKILLLKPTYKAGWTIPGGVVEANESPYVACIREIREEISLNIESLKLLAVDYRPAEGVQTEFIHFLFNAGQITKKQANQIVLDKKEISEFCWASIDDAKNLLSPHLAKRISPAMLALNENRAVYLENGLPI